MGPDCQGPAWLRLPEGKGARADTRYPVCASPWAGPWFLWPPGLFFGSACRAQAGDVSRRPWTDNSASRKLRIQAQGPL